MYSSLCVSLYITPVNLTGEDLCFYAVIALTKFKEAIYEDPHLVLSNWNALDSDPCNWNGISCSMDKNHVNAM